MSADALKSASITNLDASPVVRNTSGVGGASIVKKVGDFVTATTAGLKDTGSKYKMVRVPTDIFLQNVRLVADGAVDSGSPALAVDVGIYYSDSTTDGTPVANQGTVVSGQTATLGSAVLFGAAANLAINPTDGVWSSVKRQQPLWQAAGLTTNPGGQFDIVVAVHTAGSSSAAGGAFQATVEYADA